MNQAKEHGSYYWAGVPGKPVAVIKDFRANAEASGIRNRARTTPKKGKEKGHPRGHQDSSFSGQREDRIRMDRPFTFPPPKGPTGSLMTLMASFVLLVTYLIM